MLLRNPLTSVAGKADRAAQSLSPHGPNRSFATPTNEQKNGDGGGDIRPIDVENGNGSDVHDEVMLGFKNLSLSSVDPPKHIIANVSGYVIQGGITAVLGPSSGGKSVLMKALTGRLPTVECTGEVTFCGKPINPSSASNGFGYVPQEDTLIGDLTVRETFEVAGRLRNSETIEEVAKDAEQVIHGLGLSKVGDNVIGTVLKRGLSGGEKRRTSVGQELIVKQAMAFLDEPTSGLDGTAAYDVIKTIRDFTRRSEGDFSVMLSIHQPNRRILDLFDHILLLGRGGSLFFGTLTEAIKHFTDIGHPPPPGQVPTDFIMQVTDDSFSVSTLGQTNFTQVYATSDVCYRTVQKLEISKAVMLERVARGFEPHTFVRPGFYRQVSTLLWRDAVVALRDPTLYYLQLVLHLVYGFLVGSTFWNTPTRLDDRSTELGSSCVWMIMLQCYIHIFKVFYLTNSNRRFDSERANLSYGVTSFFFSEMLVTALAQLLWIPGSTIAFFMINLPGKAYFFSMLSLYIAALTAEGMLNLISKLTADTSLAIVISQACLVTLTVFAGGLFLPFDEMPPYWSWLQALSVFTHCSKAFLLAVYEQVNYVCPTSHVLEDSSTTTGFCVTLQHTFECDAAFQSDPLLCEVKGITVVDANAGGLSGDKWDFLLFNVVLLVAFRASVFFFLWWPKSTIIHYIKSRLASPLVRTSLEQRFEIEMLWSETTKLKKSISIFDPPRLSTSTRTVAVEHTDTHSGSPAALTAAITAAAAAVTTTSTAKNKMSHVKKEDPAEVSGGGKNVVEGLYEEGGAAFRNRRSSSSTQKALMFRDIRLELPKNGKVLIEKVTGKATAGRVLALMGPSGAGKTTLLNALSGRATYATVTGSVTLGGRALSSDDLNYVPQFDDLNEMFSLRELLTYMRRLKIHEEALITRKSVNELLQTVGLTFQADRRVSELSGGEKKRLSISLGMISEPNVLFLDEPTTGLASAAAFSVVRYISRVADQTKVVCIMTIHQPASEIFDMLEDLMLLEAGRLAYFGTTKRARTFFDSLSGGCPLEINPADYYLDLISKPPAYSGAGDGVTWKELYEKSEFCVPITSVVSPRGDGSGESKNDAPMWWGRGRTLVNNMLTYYWRTTEVHWLRLLELAILGLFVGTMFLRLDKTEISETSGASFFNIWCVLFVVVASVPAFDRDRRTHLQEMLNGAYGPALYCTAQFLASAPYIFGTALVYQSIFHWLVGFNDTAEAFVYSILLSTSLLFMMEAIMLMVVETLKNAMLACTFSMVVLGMLFLYAGFFIKPDDMVKPVQWVTFIIPTRYAFDGYLYSILHGQDYTTAFGDITGDQILQDQFAQSDQVDHWLNLFIMVLWVLGLRVAHFGLIYRGILPYRTAMAIQEKPSSTN